MNVFAGHLVPPAQPETKARRDSYRATQAKHYGTRVENITTIVGVLAALCTTASYLPQVMKTWQTRETGDLSLKMLLLLAAGLFLWSAYGVLNSDVVIIAANVTSLALLSSILYWKLRQR